MSISYELAKKLNDAGFRCAGNGGSFEDGGEIIQIPTLEELIAACGDKFKSIDRIDDDMWLATSTIPTGMIEVLDYYNKLEGTASHEENEEFVHAYGENHEIAVSKLWLLLNKKQ